MPTPALNRGWNPNSYSHFPKPNLSKERKTMIGGEKTKGVKVARGEDGLHPYCGRMEQGSELPDMQAEVETFAKTMWRTYVRYRKKAEWYHWTEESL